MFPRLYLHPDGDEGTGGDAETITIGGVEYNADETITIKGVDYTFDEIQEHIAAGGRIKDLEVREAELEKAAEGLKPFLKALAEDPDMAEKEMQSLLAEARKAAKGGDKEDKNALAKLEDQIAELTLDNQISSMRQDAENFPHFKGHEKEVFKYCSDHEIADLEEGYHAWVGRNLKTLNAESERKQRSSDAATLGGRRSTPANANDNMRPGESWYSFLTRTGQMPKGLQ